MARLPVERGEQSGQETSFAFPYRAVTYLATSQPRVEQILDVAKHVETVDDNRQAKPGPKCQPRRLFHEPPPFSAEHPSLTRHLDGQPEFQETQGGLCEDNTAAPPGSLSRLGTRETQLDPNGEWGAALSVLDALVPLPQQGDILVSGDAGFRVREFCKWLTVVGFFYF